MVVTDHRRFAVTRISRTVLVASLLAAVAAALMTGCASKGPVYVDSGVNHTSATALALLAKADASAVASKPTSEGAKLRHEALAALRRNGAAASSVADLLTRTFPSSTSGVPVYVERGSYEGKPAVLVVEATGPKSGSLSTKRLWVVGESGDVLFAGSR
jgi:predicted small lipoprotein YifL